ncbi:MAG: hypothetical protein COA88_02875 [Kordia sp.]|nr:MAG: hypothetical protein COA88_02875 [Kordia sp.]
MNTIKYVLLFVLAISLFSCSDDDAPTCKELTWYQDADGDTLGNLLVTLESCNQPDGYVGNSDDIDDTDPLNLDPIITAQITNLYAPQTGGQGQGPIGGEFIKFNFTSGQTTTNDTDWDIGFRGTTIIFNGGEETGSTDEPIRNGVAAVYIADGTFASVANVIEANFVQDSTGSLAIPTGSGNGWYTYDPTTHLINPTNNKIIVVKTRDGKYVKIKIISYYKDLDSSNSAYARYFTFDYVYQPNNGINSF